MRNYSLLCILLIFYSDAAFAQTGKFLGRVVDAKTKKPVKAANVVILGTTLGTITNFLGYFEIQGDSMEIVISHVGYETSAITLKAEARNVLIEISPKLTRLPPVSNLDSIVIKQFVYNSEWWENRMKSEIHPIEQNAEFPGGLKEFHNYLFNYMFDHPDTTGDYRESNVFFSITPTGELKVDTITNLSSSEDFLKDMFENSPQWVPAFQRHEPVSTSFEQLVIYDPKREIWAAVEQQPEYAGGMMEFYKLISKNLKYPSQARKNDIEGKVFVSFVINTDGELEEIHTVKGVGFGCDEEAERAVALSSGKWHPGIQRGKPVKTKMIVPIMFRGH